MAPLLVARQAAKGGELNPTSSRALGTQESVAKQAGRALSGHMQPLPDAQTLVLAEWGPAAAGEMDVSCWS